MMLPVTTYHDLINQVVKLYFGFCEAASAAYQMGPYSGAKRSILLFLREREAATLEELAQEFRDPAHASYGPTIVQEMIQQGWLMVFPMAATKRVRLTPEGAERAQNIFDHEQKLISQLPPGMSAADLKLIVQGLQALKPLSEISAGFDSGGTEPSTGKARAA